MKKYSVLLALLLLVGGTTVFGMGKKMPQEPSTPTAPAVKLYPAGKEFGAGGSGSNDPSYAQYQAQSSANEMCKSGKAVRIGDWNVSERGTYNFPGDCKTIDNQEYCTAGSSVTYYDAGARFRCR